jgi:pilus assembly protein Flp/PilA
MQSNLTDTFFYWKFFLINLLAVFHSREAKMLFAPKEKGQGLVEYALILVLVAVVVIVILALLGPAIGRIFSNIVNAV